MSKKEVYEVAFEDGMFVVKRDGKSMCGFKSRKALKTWSLNNNMVYTKFPIHDIMKHSYFTKKEIQDLEIWMYKAEKGGFFSWLISTQEKLDKKDSAKGLYSHVEVHFKSVGICWSSSEVDGGTRFKYIPRDGAKWDFFEQEPTDLPKIALRCEQITPARYDWRAIAHFLIPWIGDSDKRFICSEGVHHVMMTDGTWGPLSFVPAPGDVYDIFLSKLR